MDDIIGKRFGKLVVVSSVGRSKSRHFYYLCKCDCGNEKVASKNHLLDGHTKSCGCLYYKDITGNRYGKLVVLSIAQKPDISKSIDSLWLCKCDCGNEKIISSRNFRHIKSCGCFAHHRFVDITGDRYGKLVVLSKADKPKYSKSTNIFWLCRCDCGNEKVVSGGALRIGDTKSCGCLSESAIANQLKAYCQKEYNALVEYKACENYKTGHYLPFDIYIPSSRLFIEVQGGQHYDFVKYFHGDAYGFENMLNRDNKKRAYAESNGAYLAIDIRNIDNLSDAIDCVKGAIFNNE